MQFVQGRIVTENVESMARFYAEIVGTAVATNQYYVEVQTGLTSVGFSRPRFTEDHCLGAACTSTMSATCGEVILDFAATDVDAEYARIARLEVDWVLPPTTQPWGARSMLFRDPESHLVNVFSRGALV